MPNECVLPPSRSVETSSARPWVIGKQQQSLHKDPPRARADYHGNSATRWLGIIRNMNIQCCQAAKSHGSFILSCLRLSNVTKPKFQENRQTRMKL